MHIYGLSYRHFDCEYYYENYPDVKESGADAFLHFFLHGVEEARKARFFNNAWYLKTYKDVRDLGSDGYFHFKHYGKEERREVRYIYVSQEQESSLRSNYRDWLKRYESDLSVPENIQKTLASTLEVTPLISVIMPVFNPPRQFLRAAVESVLAQGYGNWELCIADDASSDQGVRDLIQEYAHIDDRIRYVFRPTNGHISEASNSALDIAGGEYIALLDHDDLLTPDALFWVVRTINAHPEADIIFSDEDKIDENGRRFEPYFKSDFNYELFLAQNMISHLGVYRREIVAGIGGFRKGYEGSQDHDLALRVLEKSNFSRVRHIPRVLYHWRAIAGSTALSIGEKSYATKAGRLAVSDHLVRRGKKATVTIADPSIGHYRVRYAIPDTQPMVSIVIATRDRADLLELCLRSIQEKTTYPNCEVVIVDNGSVEPRTMRLFERVASPSTRILRKDIDFNYSTLNNFGVSHANGEFVVLLNNDIEVLTPDWIEEMLSFAQMQDVGCVGARLWYPDMTLQHAGVILGMGGIAGHAHKHFDARSKGYFCRAIHHQQLSAVTAACLMVRKQTYEAVSGLDEDLGVAFNDIDFCLRVRATGLRNVWTPYAEMIHHESASRGLDTDKIKKRRFAREVALMQQRWGDALLQDPAYNPNLTLEHTDFSLAWPPRDWT